MTFSTLTKLAGRFQKGRHEERRGHSRVEQVMTTLIFGLALMSLTAAIRSGARMPLLFALQELIIVMLMCCQRPNTLPQRGGRQQTIESLLAWAGVMLPLLLCPGLPAPAIMVDIGRTLQIVGGVLAPVTTLTLGRGFGILAANRGIQSGGLYGIVRHPLYLAYLIANSGFVLASPQIANLAVLVVWIVVQTRRALLEEALLSADPTYQQYSARVRYRLLPGIW